MHAGVPAEENLEMSSQPAAPETSYPPLPPPPATTYRQPPKSPGLALLLSFVFPGVGQVYNGQISRAVVFFSGFVTAIYCTVKIDPMPFGLFIPFVFFFSLVDAYGGAQKINR